MNIMKIKQFKNLTKKIVEENLIAALEDAGYTVTSSSPWTDTYQYKVVKNKIAKFIMFYARHGYFNYDYSERQLKNMQKLFDKVTTDIQRHITKEEAQKTKKAKKESILKMLAVFGYTPQNSTLNTYDTYSTFKTALSNIISEEKTEKYITFGNDRVEFTLRHDGTSSYKLTLSTLDSEIIDKIKPEIAKLQDAWEISIL